MREITHAEILVAAKEMVTDARDMRTGVFNTILRSVRRGELSYIEVCAIYAEAGESLSATKKTLLTSAELTAPSKNSAAA